MGERGECTMSERGRGRAQQSTLSRAHYTLSLTYTFLTFPNAAAAG